MLFRSLAAQGQVSQGIDYLQRGIDRIHNINMELTLGSYYYYLGEAWMKIGKNHEALRAIEQGLAITHQTEALEFEAELYRLRGEIMVRERRPVEADETFTHALAIARRQSSRAWELRAATSLARFWSAQGKPAAARELLEPVYAGFSEGTHTPDVKDAWAVLDELKWK